uniref:Uncharacterized protein n=1 Tax=Nothobranchius furzeri TaxID=105023 RepID=A0A8C6KHQ0_NOTFU
MCLQPTLKDCQGWLRRFILLKLVTVLLFPHGASLPLLVSCVFSLRALMLLRSPHISTKPSTVLLTQLALADSLVWLHWGLCLGMSLCWWIEEIRSMRYTMIVLSQQLLDAHHLASLLLLGLLGLEAVLVSRWAQQTQRFRTSYWAQFCCSLVWMFVLLELVPRVLQDSRQQTYLSVLPAVSLSVRRVLWLLDSWLHYAIFNFKPQRRRASFY